MLKGIQIGKDLDSFLNEHPEIKITSHDNKIIQIKIPEDAIIVSLIIADNTLCDLQYIYNDKLHKYPK